METGIGLRAIHYQWVGLQYGINHQPTAVYTSLMWEEVASPKNELMSCPEGAELDHISENITS